MSYLSSNRWWPRLVTALLFPIVVSPSSDFNTKIWQKNMNFDNPENWAGLGRNNCGAEIFSFPTWMDPSVISFPSSIKAKQIILPRNGYFVLQPGPTVFSDSPSCPPKEATFRRQGALDWFDPANWAVKGAPMNRAVGHVERVPCHYDAVQFPSNSTFGVHISRDVTIRKFYLGDQSLSYADVALLMGTQLGPLQFQRKAETQFAVQGADDCSEKKRNCICSNYQDAIKRYICSITRCAEPGAEDPCPNTITPHGFCCPVCGYHIKINHRPEFSLEPLLLRLNEELKDRRWSIDSHVTRYRDNGAHAILVPEQNSTLEAYRVAKRLRAFLAKDPRVLDVAVGRSWEHLDGSAEASTDGMSGTAMSFVILIVILLLCGAAIFIFYWRRSSGLPAVRSLLPSSWPSINFRSRIPSSVATPSFSFHRFQNERVSHTNLRPNFENTLERTERVDNDVAEPIEVATLGKEVTVEFANDAYGVEVPTSSTSVKKEDLQPLVELDHVYDFIEVSEDSAAILSPSAEGEKKDKAEE